MIKYALFENNRIIKLLDKPFENSVAVNMADIIDGFDGWQYLFEFTQTEDYKDLYRLYLLRLQRKEECFEIVNRGKVWYDNLTEEQHQELDKWYEDWLKVTETKVIPTKPSWLK